MSTDNSSEKVQRLVTALIDDRLDEAGAGELNRLLSSSAEHRAYYRKQIDFESRMRWLLANSETDESQNEPLIGETVISPHPRSRRGPIIALIGSIAACIVGYLSLTKQSSFLPEVADSVNIRTKAFVFSSSSARWDENSRQAAEGIELENRVYKLLEGFVSLQIGKGVQVFIEAPCEFEPEHDMLFHLHKGRANIEVTEDGHGFIMRTPAGDFIDFGTRFGVAVGNDESGNDVVMSEVFTGEVRMEPRDRDASVSEMLVEGDARGLLGRKSYVEISHTIDQRPFKLNFSRYTGTQAFSRYKLLEDYNLALGKEVLGNHFYHSAEGETFPCSNITDGRVNDSGFPGDWSFWLAPNHHPTSELTIDLGEEFSIDCIQVFNTRNRHHGDRGTNLFEIYSGTDPSTLKKIGAGRLAKIESTLSAGDAPVGETYTFSPRKARYVKLVLRSFYASAPKSSSAGLNEVRVFGEDLPADLRNEITKGARRLPEDSLPTRNLALGRFIRSRDQHDGSSMAYRAIDGLIDDAAITEDTLSRWLAPDNSGGEFTIDLGTVYQLDSLELQNTSNGKHLDRGTKDFLIFLSHDGEHFHEQARGIFPPLNHASPFVIVPMENAKARYIRFVAKSFYGKGAGLSELKAFETTNPSENGSK
ncbi:MAG: discoidin domain-containing protein [Verrucomicrobiaceae bacterium]